MKKLLVLFAFLLTTANAYAVDETFILVHGALLTSSVWAPVQSYLQNNGHNVVTIDTPGRVGDGVAPSDATLSAATAKICKVAELQHRGVILVGHSQAGAVITQAVDKCASKILALVYVAAVVPESGEKAFDLLSEQDNRNFDLAAPLDEKNGVSIPNLNSPIKKLFIGDDVSDIDANRAVANMVPESIALGNEYLHYNYFVFKDMPKFYIKTSKDQIVSPETQNKYIERTQFRGVYTLETGHSPFVTQPKQLANILEKINRSRFR
jgi:pimeloyl-ACP methyl ester carboxylesterase